MEMNERLIRDFNSLSECRKMQVVEFIQFLKEKEQKNIENIMDLIINND